MTAGRTAALALALLALTGCGGRSRNPASAGYGPSPLIPPPTHAIIPVLNPAQASRWPAGAAPTAAAGFKVTRFCERLSHPRWLYVLPNGDVLAAERHS